jgi:hypothetical protein
MSYSNNPLASGSAFVLDMWKSSVTGNQVQKVGLTDINENALDPMPKTGGSVTSLSSGSLVNITSTLTRPASAVSSASVTYTVAAPCVFTWTGNPLVNGQTVVPTGTVPTGFTAGLAYYVVGVSGNNFSLATTFGGTGVTSTGSTGTCTITVTYIIGDLIGSAAVAGSVVVPSFAMSVAGLLISRIRIATNITATAVLGSYAGQGWSNANLSVNFWSVAPTYLNGDCSVYAPSTGGVNWIANFLVGLTQFGDQAIGGGPLTSAGQMAIKYGAAQSIFWDVQILTQLAPIANQTFTLTVEAMT